MMSVETYDSSDILEETTIEIDEIAIRHRALAEQIIDDPRSQQNVRDFMWHYVGHPDRERRHAGEQPRMQRDDKEYTREIFTGFSENGDLFHVRAIAGMLTEPSGYVVIWGDVKYGVSEAVVHRSDTIGGIEPRDIYLHLLDRRTFNNSPWGHCPGQYAPRHDRTEFQWRLNGEGEQEVSYREGRRRHPALHPIEEMYATIDYIETERALLARSAFKLVSDEVN